MRRPALRTLAVFKKIQLFYVLGTSDIMFEAEPAHVNRHLVALELFGQEIIYDANAPTCGQRAMRNQPNGEC